MNAQIIHTGGDDVVVLSRRDYDALLARAGDPTAEDAASKRILAETAGLTALPAEVMDRIIDGENPLAVLIAHRGLTQASVAADSGFSQPFISKLAHGHTKAAKDTIMNLSRVLKVSADVLEGIAA